MEKLHASVLALVFLLVILFQEGLVTCMKNEDGSEEWGYVQVRPSKPSAITLHF